MAEGLRAGPGERVRRIPKSSLAQWPQQRNCVAFDWDGVLQQSPHYLAPGSWVLDVSPMTAVLAAGYCCAVMTCNVCENVAAALHHAGLSIALDPAMTRGFWDGEEDGRTVLVTNRKIAAVMYVDDRALHWTYGQDPQVILDALEARRVA